MPNQRQVGGRGGSSSGGGYVRSGSAKKVNRPLTTEEKRQNKAAETYKTKTNVKDPNKVAQGKNIMANIKGKAKTTGRKQGAVVGLVAGYVAGESEKKKKNIPGVGGRSGIGTVNSRSIPMGTKKKSK
jgi:hypothetical protein